MNHQLHKAGFVSIIGKPNVGKSTLMNTLIEEKLSIITSKAQTTRHRILGILNGEHFQIVYADTPGMITPHYALQQSMMRFVNNAISDADILLWLVDVREKKIEEMSKKKIIKRSLPIFLLINKIDLVSTTQLTKTVNYWSENIEVTKIIPISALEKTNITQVFDTILNYLPEHPPYYPKDTLTDKPARFFVAEIIREKILLHYQQEIPYSTEVVITEFKEGEQIIKIRAEINVERQSQKIILIGKKGAALKEVGIKARRDLEQFLQKKIFLEQHVKIVPAWRKKCHQLHRFGYS